MSSPKSLNSVLDQYEPSIAPIESYNDVIDERNALREQNQQLWRIIEKQRIIIHQLQKINRSNANSKQKNPNAGSLSSNNSSYAMRSEKGLLGSTGDGLSQIDTQQRLRKIPSLEKVGFDGYYKPVTSPKEQNLEIDYSRAQRTQSRLSERFQLENSVSEIQNNFNFNSALQQPRKFSEGFLDKESLCSLNNFNVKEKSPYLHRAPSESTLQTINSRQNSSTNNKPFKKASPTKSSESLSVLKVPRRSSLRVRRDTSPKNLIGSVSSPDQSVPDLRRIAVKEKDSKPGLSPIIKENIDNIPSDHTTALDFIKEAPLSDSTSSSRRASQQSSPSHSKPRKKTSSLISPKEFSSDAFGLPCSDIKKSIDSPTKSIVSISGSSLSTSQHNDPRVSLSSPALFSTNHRKCSLGSEENHPVYTSLSPTYQDLNKELNSKESFSGPGSYSNTRILRMVPEELETVNDEDYSSLLTQSLSKEKESPIHIRSPSQGLDSDTLLSSDTICSINPGENSTQDSPIRIHSRNRKATIMQYLDSRTSNSSSPTSDKRVVELRRKYSQITGVVSQSTIANHDQVTSQSSLQMIYISLLGLPLSTPASKESGTLPPIPQELWCIEKSWDMIVSLDTQLREHNPNLSFPSLPSWPASSEDIQLFINSIINNSLSLGTENDIDETLLNLIGDFLFTNIKTSQPNGSDSNSSEQSVPKKVFKAGNLLKRGKKFGKLKLRYFVVSGPTLEYFESLDGFYLGGIQLLGAQIIRSMVASLHSEVYDRYIYAITIMEPKKSNLIKHTFFVDNPCDWDEWLLALEHYSRLGATFNINGPSSVSSGTTVAAPRRIRSHDSLHSDSSVRHLPRALDFSFPETRHENLPKEALSQKLENDQPSSPSNKISISQSHDATLINSASITSPVRPDGKPIATKSKMQGFMNGVKGKNKDVSAEKNKSKNKSGTRKTFQWNTKLFGDAFQKKSHGPTKVFGVTLEQAIAQAPIKTGYQMPTVLHRCIEYLEFHKAYLEEGIYRLSGSAADIQYLKEKFDNDGDYNLLKSGQRYDVHTVAGLLKLYLREMPTYVLTVELQPEFIQAVENPLRHHRVNEIGRLVCALPLANYTLLRTLTAHLIRIVEKSDVNKMTLRNIGIVFVPTLAVPAGVFSLMVVEFEYIFWVNERGTAQPKTLEPILDQEVDSDIKTSPVKDVDSKPSTTLDSTSLDTNTESTGSNSIPSKHSILANSPRLMNASLAADFDSSMRDHRNSSMYREVVPEELATAEHGLESTVLELADDDEDSLSSCLDEEDWNLDQKDFIISNPAISPKNLESSKPTLAASYHGATIWEGSAESSPDSDSVHSAPAQSILP